MNDTTRRFLNAIVDRIPAGGRIVELRLFPAIRQGGIESGVAVVAVEPPEVPVAGTETGASDAEVPGEGVIVDFAVAAHDIVDIDVITEDEEGLTGDEIAAASSFVPVADAVGEEEVGEVLDEELSTIVVSVSRDVIAAQGIATVSGDHGAVAADEAPAGDRDRGTEVEVHVEPSAATDASPYADAALPAEAPHRPILADIGAHAEPDETVALSDILALPSPDAAPDAERATPEPTPPPRHHRYAILTAHYRLTLKGPDRGKWDVEIIHEADAPLDTVERVARGVAKRAGEESDPESFSGESLRAALDAPVWATTP